MEAIDYKNPIYDAPVDNSVDGIVTAVIMLDDESGETVERQIFYKGYRGPGYVQLVVTKPEILAPCPYIDDDIEEALTDEFRGEEVRFDYIE